MPEIPVSAGQRPISRNPSASAESPALRQSSPPRPVTSEAPHGARALPLRLLDHVRKAFRKFVSVLPCGPRRPGASTEEPTTQRLSGINRPPLQLALDRRDSAIRASAQGMGDATKQIQENVDQELAALAADARLDASPTARDRLSGKLRIAFINAESELRRFRIRDEKQLREQAVRQAMRPVDVMREEEDGRKVASLFVAAGLGKLPEDDRRLLLQAMGTEELPRVANVDENTTSAATRPVIGNAKHELERRADPAYARTELRRRDTERIKDNVAERLISAVRTTARRPSQRENDYLGRELKGTFCEAESSLRELENGGSDIGEEGYVRATTLFFAAALGGLDEKDRRLLLRGMQPADLQRVAETNPDTTLNNVDLGSTDRDKIEKAIRAAKKEATRREYPVSQALRDARAPELADIPPRALEDIEKNVREELARLACAAKADTNLRTIGAQLTDVLSRAESALRALEESGPGIDAEGGVRAASLFVAAGLAGLDEADRNRLLRHTQPEELERLSTVAEDTTLEQMNPVIHATNHEIVRREVGSSRTFESATDEFCRAMEVGSWDADLKRIALGLIKLDRHLAALTGRYEKIGRDMDPVVTGCRSRIGEVLRDWLKKEPEGWDKLLSGERASTLAALERFGAPPPQELLKKLKNLK
jgi:hypothetical protein